MPRGDLFFSNALIYLTFLAVLVAIQRKERQPYLRWWISAYTVFTCYYVLGALDAAGLRHDGVQFLNEALMLVAAALVVVGIYRFAARRVPPVVLALVGLPLFYVVLSGLLGWPPRVANFVRFFGVAAALIAVGYSVARWPYRGFGRVTTATGFFVFGAWAALIPFIHDTPLLHRLEPYGDLFCVFLISIGIVLMHFERAWEEQRQVATRYASLFASSPVGLFRIDEQGRMEQINPALRSTLGLEGDDPLLTLDSLPQSEEVRETLQRSIAEQREVEGEELLISGKNGSIRVMLTLSWQHGEGGRVWADGVLRDVTAEHALRERIERAQRVEALGRLAGGIAHDFNNILTVVISSVDLARHLCQGEEERKHLDRAMGGAERAAKLTRQLLSLTQQPARRAGVVNLCNVVVSECELLERALGEKITLEVEVTQSEMWVRAEASELSQIIINLVFNARDAMPAGGKISIRLSASERRGSSAVSLEVRDTGEGMDEQTRARIFDPFFTTKGLGEGTGLGLATVYGIVRSLEGEISLESELGVGTAFEIFLPTAEPPDTSGNDAEREQGSMGGAKILVVEDEPGVRLVAERILRDAEHEVQGASCAEEALEVFSEGEVDLLITDVVLPGLSGPELAERLGSRCRGVLYISGYARDLLSEGDLADASYLPKPFTAEGLRQATYDALKKIDRS